MVLSTEMAITFVFIDFLTQNNIKSTLNWFKIFKLKTKTLTKTRHKISLKKSIKRQKVQKGGGVFSKLLFEISFGNSE